MNGNHNYISIFDNAISKEQCDVIINEFEYNKDKHVDGMTGSYKVQPDQKKSIDLLCKIDDSSSTSKILSKSLNHHVQLYKNKYPDVNNLLYPWSCGSLYNVQKYYPKWGFFSRHCEVTNMMTSNRVLTWMFYLNNVQNGGTLFPSNDIVVDAVEGRLVICPSYWTHGHQGQISETHIKYIATGWYVFAQENQ